MSENALISKAERLGSALAVANIETRQELFPDFRRVLNALRESGHSVPAHLSLLEQNLQDETTEALFDNMPV